MSAIKISIIVPTLNEEEYLRRCLSALNLTEDEELIVVDGGSTDTTVSIAREFTDKVLSAKRGRAAQMNAGAEAATGDVLLFLHADCVLPPEVFSVIRDTIANEKVSAGAFWLAIEHPGLVFRIIERGANLRSAVTRLIYGDQGIFLSKETFLKLKGFADIPLMEDIEISQRLKRLGRIVFVNPPIKTLPRRWLKEGPLRTTLRDWKRAISYTVFNASPGKLAEDYEDIR